MPRIGWMDLDLLDSYGPVHRPQDSHSGGVFRLRGQTRPCRPFGIRPINNHEQSFTRAGLWMGNPMIPSIGLIVSVYVMLRCLEMLCAAESRFSSRAARKLVAIACALTIVFTGLMIAGLIGGGTAASNALSGLSFIGDAQPTQSPKRTAAEIEKYNAELKELIRKTRADMQSAK